VYVIIWAFRPRPGREADFDAAYGPAGAWAALFRNSPGFLGTELLRAADGTGLCLTVDRWTGREAYDAFRAAHGEQYDALDRACADLTASEVSVGTFDASGASVGA
jgi:heme-degrading monooxygenase HmoA